MIDCDAEGNTSAEAAKTIEYSLRKFKALVEIQLAGQCTDSGGGGTLDLLAKELKSMPFVKKIIRWVVAACIICKLSYTM